MALSTPPILITPRSHHPFSFPTAHHPSKQAPFSSSSSSISRLLQPLRLLSPPATTFHFKCFSKGQRQSDEQVEFERLFSNLNQATLKREPGRELRGYLVDWVEKASFACVNKLFEIDAKERHYKTLLSARNLMAVVRESQDYVIHNLPQKLPKEVVPGEHHTWKELSIYQEAKEADAEKRRALLEDRDKRKNEGTIRKAPGHKRGADSAPKETPAKKRKLVKKYGKDVKEPTPPKEFPPPPVTHEADVIIEELVNAAPHSISSGPGHVAGLQHSSTSLAAVARLANVVEEAASNNQPGDLNPDVAAAEAVCATPMEEAGAESQSQPPDDPDRLALVLVKGPLLKKSRSACNLRSGLLGRLQDRQQEIEVSCVPAHDARPEGGEVEIATEVPAALVIILDADSPGKIDPAKNVEALCPEQKLPPVASSGGEPVDDASCSSCSSFSYTELEHKLKHIPPGSPDIMPSAQMFDMVESVGAGILAIPAVTQESGFLASAVTCFLCWVYMVVTGLLIAEVNVNTMCELGSGGVSLVSMAMRTLGPVGVQIACWSYLFIHYALLVAYVARSSDILTNFLGIPIWESATLFSLVFGGICYFGSQRFIGAINGVLVFGIIISFAALVAATSGDLQWDALLKANFEAVPLSIPIIALSFVYQNVVPVLCTNLEGNLSKVRTSIVLGTAIPLVLFLVWNAVILGSITNIGTGADKIIDPIEQLRSSNGVIGPIVEVFSLFAIATSYIGFVLGLADFLADLLKLPAGQSSPLPYLLTLVPPLVLSLLDPEIFFKALDFAGTYGVLVLFGILPAAMSWSDRSSSSEQSPRLPYLVPGGKLTLSLIIGGAGCVILSELLENFGPGHP